jgi:trans-aconitate 2-methyltransferase
MNETAARGTHVWDPGQYLKFADHRLRPAVDLIARIPRERCARIWDLGCGSGNVTRLLAERWPGARVIGLDSSAEMLVKAQGEPGIECVLGDIADWAPPEPADLVFSNATLHWLPDHPALFARLFDALAPGGVLAVQMPRNHEAPSHAALRAVAERGPWAARVAQVLPLNRVDSPADYHRWLAPRASAIDIWESEYLHVLEGENPIVEWTRGTALKPFLDALDPAEAKRFLAYYAARVAAAYPPQPDGTTLFPFRRLFIVAVKA